MRIFPALVAALLPASLIAAEPGTITVAVDHIPPGATEIVAVVDVVAPMTSVKPEEPVAAVAAPPPAKVDSPVKVEPAPAGAIPPAPAPAAPRRRRGGLRGAATATFPPERHALATHGATSATLDVSVPPGENYRVRIVALLDAGRYATVLAGGRMNSLSVAPGKSTAVRLELKPPRLQLASENPASVASGAHFTLAGRISDAANSLGTKNRLRVWLSPNVPPRENYSGAQISTVDVKSEGDDVTFSLALTAPAAPGPLYFQCGELADEFASPDGNQAPFLLLPNLANEEAPLSLRVVAPPDPK